VSALNFNNTIGIEVDTTDATKLSINDDPIVTLSQMIAGQWVGEAETNLIMQNNSITNVNTITCQDSTGSFYNKSYLITQTIPGGGGEYTANFTLNNVEISTKPYGVIQGIVSGSSVPNQAPAFFFSAEFTFMYFPLDIQNNVYDVTPILSSVIYDQTLFIKSMDINFTSGQFVLSVVTNDSINLNLKVSYHNA
jgi:hypothetical protein